MGEDILDKLSAEREIKTIGRIGGGGGVVMMSCDIVQEAINEIARLREERRWIPVGERLPELRSRVLVAWGYEEDHEQSVSQAWHDRPGLFTDQEDEEFPGVTHWQPLPAPPNGGEVE